MSEIKVDLGLNTCCFTRRWEEPENWIRLSKEAGYDYIQFDSDALDPFFSGDLNYQLKTAKEVKQYAQEYGVTVSSYYTGMASYRFHGISHSDERPRERMKRWVIQTMDLSLAMGGKMVGGRFDAYSVETLAHREKFDEQLKCSCDIYRELALIGKEKGLSSIDLEQMYVPSLYPYTIQQTYDYIAALNTNNEGCRLGITVDIGHAASQNYGGTGDNLLYEEWLKHFAAVSEEIHIQQTPRPKSAHDPFTKECNKAGDINISEVLAAIKWSHENTENLEWSQYLKPVDKHILVLEYLPSTSATEEEVLSSIHESNAFLRNYVPTGGITIKI